MKPRPKQPAQLGERVYVDGLSGKQRVIAVDLLRCTVEVCTEAEWDSARDGWTAGRRRGPYPWSRIRRAS